MRASDEYEECSCHKDPVAVDCLQPFYAHISAGPVHSVSRRPVTLVRQSPNSNSHTTSPTGPSTQHIQTTLPSPLPLTVTCKRPQRIPFVAHTFPIHVQRSGGAIQYACTPSNTHLQDHQRHGEGETHPGAVIWFVFSLISLPQIVFFNRSIQ